MVVKFILVLLLIAIIALSAPHLSSIKVTPEYKQQRLTIEVIPPSPLEFTNLRWDHMPLTVYIDSRTAGKDSYPIDVKAALEMWRDVTKGVISFEIAKSRDNADISVTWVRELKSESLDAAGNTDAKFFNQTKFKILTGAEIQLLNRFEGREMSDFDMINLATHEIGHALGLDHNDVEGSIMNPVLKIPSSDINNITVSEIKPLIDAYKIPPKADLYISPNSTATKIVDQRLFKELYYINVAVTVENVGIIESTNTTMQIKVDGNVVREDSLPRIPIGSLFTRAYTNQPIEGNFSTVEILLDPEDFVDELDEANNLLIMKV